MAGAAEQTWYETVEVVTPHVVRILTPRGSGTGFLFHRPTEDLVGLATAAHVVNLAHAWEEPMRIVHASSGASVLLRSADRAVFLETVKDTAAIVFPGSTMEALPKQTLTLAPEKKHLKVGNQIGWLGFPSVAESTLCFFGGRVSAYVRNSYLVDGVAINGVSGGPAFHMDPGGPILMGVLSAYIPNRATGETLPGLAVIQDVSQLHDLIKDFNNLNDAQKEQTPPASAAPPTDDSSGDTETPRAST